MISRIWLINLILLAVLVFLGVENYAVWSRGNQVPTLKSVDTGRKIAASQTINIKRRKPQDASSYEVIAAENLFSPDRKEFIPEEIEPEVVEDKPEPVKEEEPPVKLSRDVIVYGIVIMDGYKSALVSNPPDKQNKKQRIKKKIQPKTLIVKENDSLGGFTVKEILKDRIVLTEADDIYEVLLYDEEKPDREIPTPEKAAPKNILGASKTAQEQSPAGEKQGAASSEKKPQPKEEVEYINTPFGKIKRVK